VMCHSTERSRMVLSCAIDHELESLCPHSYKTDHTESFGQVAFTIDARPGVPIHLTKYIAYHTSKSAGVGEIGRLAEWTLDRVSSQGFSKLLSEQEQYMKEFWEKSDIGVSQIRSDRIKLSTVEMQQAIRLNLFHILQASARAEDTGVPAKGVTGHA